MDAFDRWWQWAEKPLSSPLTIPAEIHEPIMQLAPEDRRDRVKVNEAVAAGGSKRSAQIGRSRITLTTYERSSRSLAASSIELRA
jgi:hypothetical protein